MVLSGVKNKINMIEFQGSEADEELIAQGFEIGQKVINQICDFQEAIQKEIGKEKTSLNFITIDETFKKRAYELLQAKQQEILFSQTMNKLTKQTEMTLLAKDVTEQLKSEGFDDDKLNTLTLIIEELTNDILHKEILQKDNRPDGRSLTEIRQLDVMIDVIARTHGNALFVRGDTQTLSTVTLGSPLETLSVQSMENVMEKRYFHHYNFPQ
jgi:polyribonucleotide nucleotidyltransferase